jgi:RimJ/RimL family protein N-acetyltransferase
LKTIETERLTLRGWKKSDDGDLFAFFKNDSILLAGASVHKTIKESRAFIQACNRSDEIWAIVLRNEQKVIGWIGLYDTNRHAGYKETEYVISDVYKNHGVATESLKAVLRYAFEERKALAVAACHYPENTASKRVLEKCGFVYEGTLREFSKNMSDSVRYSILKEEWASLYGNR